MKLAPEVFPGVWKQVVKSARPGKITARIVKEVVQNFLPNRQGLDDEKRHFDSKRKFPMGQVLALLHDVETKVKKSQNDAALVALERIEALLFGDPIAKALRR